MVRSILSALCLFALVGFVTAEEKKEEKKGTTVMGKYDGYKDGKLTILVVEKKGEDAKAKEFEVKADTKVTVLEGTEKKEAVAKDAFGEKLAKGTPVTLTIDAEKKITAIQVGAPKKGK